MDTKFRDFEATMATLSQRMDDLEMDIQQLKAQIFPQHSTSASINPGKVSSQGDGIEHGNGNGDRGTTPMDT